MAKHTIAVEGMSCDHCKKTVETAVKENKDVVSVVATPAEDKVDVELSDDAALDQVKQLIYDVGYDVK
ncbi:MULTISPECIES: cation transporter [unclassified Staphylococcus]|uniref:cation transporter n=1 Tax=unclassified Staphylococcus TaxID=91994 RepID=UPI0021D267B7|nr:MULTISPECIES: cation transporter [unclassified Staphylococcus]UXR69121.1 cation transporter [Staphylococcus sp. IVB6246]UXR71175.1 cation transporter [Staphylococcus sp. IVB6240]UXR73448.1 cation transporter [Staphylococcus sp. IVB6238]UXR75765.1 cation transporter [Staphylococcus sp. IVB6233]UXR79964.1 cation transporter [Staphylococcus sp. IVB6218]